MRGKENVRKGKTETQDAVSNETADVQGRSTKNKSRSQLLKDETHDEDKQSGPRGRAAKAEAKKAVVNCILSLAFFDTVDSDQRTDGESRQWSGHRR